MPDQGHDLRGDRVERWVYSYDIAKAAQNTLTVCLDREHRGKSRVWDVFRCLPAHGPALTENPKKTRTYFNQPALAVRSWPNGLEVTMRRWLVGALTVLSLALVVSAAAGAKPLIIKGFVPVPGGKLFFEERGAGPAVILIHGGMLDHRMWDPQIEALARHHRVIRYDVASHGQSPTPEGPWKSFEHLGLLMQELKEDSASLVGLSMGGRIAIDFAIAHPEKVRALVLVDPGMSGFPFTGRDFTARQGESYRAQMAGDARKVAELFMRSWLAGPHRTPSQVDPAVWAKVLEMATPNALKRLEGLELEPPAVSRLSEIEAPVLVIEGELDCEDIRRITSLIERRVPGTRRVVIPGVAHMPNLERPAEVNRLLVDFLRLPRPIPAGHSSFQARQEMVEVEGGRLWVEHAGEGDPVVLIHDGIVHSVGWDDVMTALSSQFGIIRYDRRGYGRSTAPHASFSHLTDLEAVLRHLAVGKVHLIGSSSGGGLAIDFALAHPEQVASLTLVGAVVSGFPYTRHFAGRGSRLSQATFGDPALYRRYWTSTDPYFIAPDSKAVRERVAAILEASPQNLDTGRDRFAIAPPAALPRLGSMRVPALVLAGEHDIPDVHAHAGAIAAVLPHARREVMAGCGHMPYLEQPVDFATYVLAFLQSAPFLGVLDNDGPAKATQALRAARATNRAAILASENELSSRGYRSLGVGALPDAIAIFRLNTEAFPASPNAHDSLGEALLAAGDRVNATAAYRKALEIDPKSESALKALQTIEALPKQSVPTSGQNVAFPFTSYGASAQGERTVVEKTIRDAIGWALTKDQARLESILAHDDNFFIFHPDSKSTVHGWESFTKLIADFMDPRFKATRFDVRDLSVTFSRSGDVAWFSALLEDCGEWNGKPSCWKDTRWTGALEKRGEGWVIVQMHFSFAKDKVLEECPKTASK
jgi:pimeloyl-ACP methyl ester carboxylesterase